MSDIKILTNGRKATIFFRNQGTSARIYESAFESFSLVPSHYYFKYADGEENRELVNPDIDQKHGDFNLTEPMISHMVSKGIILFDGTLNIDGELSEYEDKLQKYLEEKIVEEDRPQAIALMSRLVDLKGEKFVIDNYFQ